MSVHRVHRDDRQRSSGAARVRQVEADMRSAQAHRGDRLAASTASRLQRDLGIKQTGQLDRATVDAYQAFLRQHHADTFEAPERSHAGRAGPQARAAPPAAHRDGGGGGSGLGGGGGVAPTAASSSVAPIPDPTGGSLDQWIAQAFAVLEANGVPANELDANALKQIIMHESGANPNAVNNWDSNAKAGHPSKGLMQTIQSTFDAYKLPGYNNILGKVDNIIAGTRYILARYGSFGNVPGIKALAAGHPYVGY